MKTSRLVVLVLAVLALTALLILFFSPREGSRYGESPSAPAEPVVPPSKPVVAAVAEKKAVRQVPAEKLVKRRKKRVSSLRDPGEAMGGGVHSDITAKTTGLTPHK